MTATSDEEPTKSVLEHLRAWGTNPVPATGAAALIVALHSATSVRHDRTDYAPQKMLSARAAGVVRALPIYIITPMLLGSSYLNVTGNKTDAAGISAAASMTYASLAMKRRQVGRRCFVDGREHDHWNERNGTTALTKFFFFMVTTVPEQQVHSPRPGPGIGHWPLPRQLPRRFVCLRDRFSLWRRRVNHPIDTAFRLTFSPLYILTFIFCQTLSNNIAPLRFHMIQH